MADSEDTQAEPEPDSPPEPEPETDEAPSQHGADAVGRTELKVQRARLTIEEEAEAARRRVLGSHRSRQGPAAVQTSRPDDDAADLSERLRELVRGVEEETERLQDDVSRLRSAAGRAGTTLHDEIERAASELAEQSVGELETTAGQSVEALTATVDTLQETAASLNTVAAGLLTSVGQLTQAAPVAEQLAELAAAPPAIPEALAGVISDLAAQLAALADAVSTQVRAAVEEALAAELGRHEARIEHALARLVDELARLRRRLPVAKRGAAIDLSKEQLAAIGQSVGDYLLGAMREQQS
jgi:hypothetical protein